MNNFTVYQCHKNPKTHLFFEYLMKSFVHTKLDIWLFIKIILNICISLYSPVISDVMIKIQLAVALYTLVTSGWNSLPYNVFFFICLLSWKPTNSHGTKVWFDYPEENEKQINVTPIPKSNIKHDSWLSTNMGNIIAIYCW
jgi:hypothetical protein